MTGWGDLERALDAWSDAGRHLAFWWRDDDAAAVTPSLRRLLDLSRRRQAPLALAVVPEPAEPALARHLAEAAPGVWALQHGYDHANHAPAGEKKQELGPHRDPAVMAAQLAEGRTRLTSLFGSRALPVLVPPWNRIDPRLVGHLGGLGFTGLSGFGPRPCEWPAPGLRQVNCHLDVFAWKPQRRFLGAAAVLDRLVAALEARRSAEGTDDEPLGLMTHHLYHDEEIWSFLDSLLKVIKGHETVRITEPPAVFWEAGVTSALAPERAGTTA